MSKEKIINGYDIVDNEKYVRYEDYAKLLKQQPKAGDFTKNVRLSVQSRKDIIAKITDVNILAVIGWIPQLCDRLDREEATKKDLLEACEAALPFIVAHDIQQKVVSGAALKLQTLIAKAKKESGE